MITKNNIRNLLEFLEFKNLGSVYEKHFQNSDSTIKIDLDNEKITYPEDKGLVVNSHQTCENFNHNENFVVFECVHRLLQIGFLPSHIELEQAYSKIKKEDGGGRADVVIKDNQNQVICIVECKTAGDEFDKHWKNTLLDGDQLFRYLTNKRETEFLCLYSSNYIDNSLHRDYHLISLKDNEDFLDSLVKSGEYALSFKEAKKKNKEDIFKAWADTYKFEYSTRGLFENNIDISNIGERKFSKSDLKNISSKDIQGKYHEFATILRQHNVSGRENAFDKLVNLFLCKIVDESQNPDGLKFYWKGVAFDSYFELQDRLQSLYQQGMKELLGEDVTYIDNKSIDDAFKFFKSDPDSTKDTIKKYFRELKFFTSNDFAFIDVHNEKLFYQNAEVLLKMVMLLQDIKLKTEEQNQFLGDMFEGFLDQGVKQSEGQFFTPMPIVKFIISSLPLSQFIDSESSIPKVIDYACGAGHFLNEYAQLITPMIEEKTNTSIKDYFKAIEGVEKEYRLSKVAKVSAFMYGQDDINIIYDDALSKNGKMKEGTYSVLVANPPYSVKGFLQTLSKEDRGQYQLTECIDPKSYASNNSIETFFIERAKQLLKPNGVAAIIVPSTILSKGASSLSAKRANVYVRTRELLIKYFDVLAIAELGSGTFGKTGTNTVTLFLRRRQDEPSSVDHYRNRVESWFNNDFKACSIFKDLSLIEQYCEKMEYEIEDYKKLIGGELTDSILGSEVFETYFEAFNKSTVLKSLKKKASFKALSSKGKESEIKELSIKFILKIEKEKVYFFILSSLSNKDTLIIRSPKKNAESKKFLGYEWSSAKGSEGIKYLGNESVTSETTDDGDEVLEQEEKRVIENLLNLNNIQTPLYNPSNIFGEGKINSLIRSNFGNDKVEIPSDFHSYIRKAKLADMIDFTTADFNKNISLIPKVTFEIDTQWEYEKLRHMADSIVKGKTPKYGKSEVQVIKSGQAKGYTEFDFSEPEYLSTASFKKENILNSGDILFNTTGVGTAGRVTLFNHKGKFVTDSHITRFRANQDKVLPEFLINYLTYVVGFNYLESLAEGASGQIELPNATIQDFKIPLPPMVLQETIKNECLSLDKKLSKNIKLLEEARNEINELVTDNVFRKTKLKDVSEKITESVDPKAKSGMANYVGLQNIEKNTGQVIGELNTPYSEIKSTKSSFNCGDVLYGKLRPNLNKVYLADGKGICSTDILVYRFKSKEHAKFYSYYMRSKDFNSEVVRTVSGQQLPRTSAKKMEPILVPDVSQEELKSLISSIELKEEEIDKAIKLIESFKGKKKSKILELLK